MILRRDCQFHWYNHGYDSFDAFLATFTAEKRKKAKRERRRVAEAGIEFDTLHGGDMDACAVGHRISLLRRHLLPPRP